MHDVYQILLFFYFREFIDRRDSNGHTPLYYAFHDVKPKIVSTLLHNGADFLNEPVQGH